MGVLPSIRWTFNLLHPSWLGMERQNYRWSPIYTKFLEISDRTGTDACNEINR